MRDHDRMGAAAGNAPPSLPRRAALAGMLCAAVVPRAGALAQPGAPAYPARPIRVVSAYAPGGVVDILARLVGDRMGQALGQPFVVEARPGAGGNIGTAYVARAKGDPYTLLLGASGPLAINIALGQPVGYDPLADFQPISLVAATPMLLVVPKSSPAKSFADLLAWIRSQRQSVVYGSGGPGTPQHLAGEMFRQRVGFEATHVPYQGSAPAVTALLAAEVPYIFDNLALVLPHIRSGGLRALAVAGRERTPQLPDVPTIAELGFPAFEARGWYGLLAPAGIPEEVTRRLHAETIAALKEASVSSRLLNDFGSPFVGCTPEEFYAFMAAEIEKWRGVVRTGRLTVG